MGLDIVVALMFLVATIVIAIFLIIWARRQLYGKNKKDFERKQDENKRYRLKPEVWKMLEELDKKNRRE